MLAYHTAILNCEVETGVVPKLRHIQDGGMQGVQTNKNGLERENK